MEEIDNNLKAMMVLRAQEVKLMIKSKQGDKLCFSWNDIGKAWRKNDSIDTASKVNKITNTTFDNQPGYEIYMENWIMKQLQLKYEEKSCNKEGCIVRMIATRNSELNRLINKQAESTHQNRISSKRSAQSNDSSERKIKGSFTIKGPKGDKSYNRGLQY